MGFGRTGTLFACEQAAVSPDFLCLSKGLSGGALPLSAVLTTDAIFEAFWSEDRTRAFLHSHSFAGNPVACAAGVAVLETIRDENLVANARGRGEMQHRVRQRAQPPKRCRIVKVAQQRLGAGAAQRALRCCATLRDAKRT